MISKIRDFFQDLWLGRIPQPTDEEVQNLRNVKCPKDANPNRICWKCKYWDIKKPDNICIFE
jgi:hypothetical protein